MAISGLKMKRREVVLTNRGSILSAVLHTPQNVIAYEQIVDDTQIRLVTKALESLCLIYLKLAVIRFRKSN